MKDSGLIEMKAFSLLSLTLGLAFATALIAILQMNVLRVWFYANSALQSSYSLDETRGAEKTDIAGLVDVNTARLDLVEEMLSETILPGFDLIQTLRDRRAKGQPFSSVDDYLALPEFANQNQDAIRSYLTVHSGQSGIAPEHAPLGLLELLTGRTGDRGILERAIRPEWKSAPTNRVFRIPMSTRTSGQPYTYAIYAKTGGIETSYSLVALD